MCHRCLSSFSTQQSLDNHLKICSQSDAIIMRLPNEDYLRFNKFHYKINFPFRVYADFE